MEKLDPYLRCGECEARPAVVDCKDCSESYCRDCSDAVHQRGMRKTHGNFVRLHVCARCVAAAATVACGDCEGKTYCDRCNKRLHSGRGRFKRHEGILPVAEFFGTGEAVAAVDKDAENAFDIKVKALVASPRRTADSRSALCEVVADADDVARGDDEVAAPHDGTAGSEAGSPERNAPTTLFTDPETHRLAVGAQHVQERVWGWRRLSKLMPDGVLFDSGSNALLRTKYPVDRPPRAPGAAVEEDSTESLDLTALPRFPRRPAAEALCEDALNAAVLGVALGGPVALARIFASAEHQQRGMYAFQFFARHTRPEQMALAVSAARGTVTDASPARVRADPDETIAPSSPQDVASPGRQRDQLLNATSGAAVDAAFVKATFAKPCVPYTVDDVVPIGSDRKPLFGLTEHGMSEKWKVLLTKAVAKHYGSYAAIEQANVAHLLQLLTGGRVTAETWSATTPTLRDPAAAARFAWWKIRAAKRHGHAVLLARRDVTEIECSPCESLPAEWGSFELAESAALEANWSQAAVALFTAELSHQQANKIGVRRPADESLVGPEGWNLIKLNQWGDDAGAERFSFAHFCPTWSKELRDHFDFTSSDCDLVYATPNDVATAFDTIFTCSGISGVAPSHQLQLHAADSESTAFANSQQILVVLQPTATSFTVRDAEAFNVTQGQRVDATSALKLRLVPLDDTRAALLAARQALENGVERSVPVPAVTAINVALGQSRALPDRFQVRGLKQQPPRTAEAGEGASADASETAAPAADEANAECRDIGRAYTLVVTQQFHRDAIACILGFDPAEVAFTTVL